MYNLTNIFRDHARPLPEVCMSPPEFAFVLWREDYDPIETSKPLVSTDTSKYGCKASRNRWAHLSGV